MQANKKLLFFDVDGTLLDSGTNTVPESAKKALEMAHNNGHYIFINSGRTVPMLFAEHQLKGLPIDGFLCGCGIQIFYQNEVLFHHRIDRNIQQSIADLLIKYNLQSCLEGENYIYFPRMKDEELHPVLLDVLKSYTHNGNTVKYLDDPEVDFDKFLIYNRKDIPQTEEFKEIIKEISNNFDIINREGDLYEFLPHGLSKATGIDYMCKYLGASLDDCYAFGDSTNDTAMLTHVPHSIAMGNAMTEILDLVSYVTTPTYQDGIYNAMKHFELI